MLRSLLRVFFAFAAACLAAGIVQVFFAFPPSEIANAESGLSLAGIMTIIPKAAVQSALFAAPFVLVAAAVAEWQSLQDWTYYMFVGIAIAFAGFTALNMGEGAEQTLFHHYAMRAFLTTGAIAGFVYWMAGGRNAGGVSDVETDGLITRDMSAAPRTALRPDDTAKTVTPAPNTTSVI